MTYNELFDRIIVYIEQDDDDFVGMIPTFVTNVEEEIYNTVQLPATRSNVTGVTTIGNKYLSLPTDFLSVYSIAVIDPSGEYVYLVDKDVNFIREAYPVPAVSGRPVHYAVFDEDALIFGPTPDAEYTVELHYNRYPESLVTAGTTWVSENYSSVLLYGCLVEANVFIKGEQDITDAYKKEYEEALGRLKVLGDGKKRSDAYRSGQARVAVK